MKIRQIRNATILLDYGDKRILVDPMLARAGCIPSLKWATRTRRKNPLVDLPPGTDQVLEAVTHVLVTHCQKGHFDHLDRAAIKWIKRRQLPVLCETQDARYLSTLGLEVQTLDPDTENEFAGGEISLVPCRHGTGIIGSLMAHGYGYVLDFPGHPRVYVIGDSILTNEIRSAIGKHKPDIVIMPAGGAQFDLGGEIIMSAEDVLPIVELCSGSVIVNHLEALDHCPVTREQIKEICRGNGLGMKLRVPMDGEEMQF